MLSYLIIHISKFRYDRMSFKVPLRLIIEIGDIVVLVVVVIGLGIIYENPFSSKIYYNVYTGRKGVISVRIQFPKLLHGIMSQQILKMHIVGYKKSRNSTTYSILIWIKFFCRFDLTVTKINVKFLI